MADLPKEPVTRQEMYLSRLAGENTTLPIEPVTREEMYLEGAIDRVEAVEQEVEEMKDNPDVADIVATYADLQAYDTSKLTDKDVIRVLTDEAHDGQSTYYRYNKQSDSWTYIGAAGDYYTKTAADAKFQDKLTAGTNVSISAQNVISATDTTYSAFTGTDGTAAGQAGLVPAPATTDAGKVLGAGGTWVTGGPTVVQITGTSTTDVMSQNAVTSIVYGDPSTKYKVNINGGSSNNGGDYSVNIGAGASSTGDQSVTIGYVGGAGGDKGVAIGRGANAGYLFSVALGAGSTTSAQGEINVGTGNIYPTKGYNNSNYRLLSGLYDPQSAHDAATKGYVDANAGGPTVVQTTGTSTTDVMSQDAVTNELYPQYSAHSKGVIGIGNYTSIANYGDTKIGIGNVTLGNSSAYAVGINGGNSGATVNAISGIGIWSGTGGSVTGQSGIAIGTSANVSGKGGVAIGRTSSATLQGEFNIGSSESDYGYNNTNYRLLTGLYDPQAAHDAATKGYVDSLVGNVAAALNAINNGSN